MGDLEVVRQKRITRESLKANPDTLYIFGDNYARKGFGGQAKEMRGEPNAFGIATKFFPDNLPESYFDDNNKNCWEIVENDFNKLFKIAKNYKRVVIPEDEIGTGLADLRNRAPKLLEKIEQYFKTLEKLYG